MPFIVNLRDRVYCTATQISVVWNVQLANDRSHELSTVKLFCHSGGVTGHAATTFREKRADGRDSLSVRDLSGGFGASPYAAPKKAPAVLEYVLASMTVAILWGRVTCLIS